MKENYAAWDIAPNDFWELTSITERLKLLVGFAVLAPQAKVLTHQR